MIKTLEDLEKLLKLLRAQGVYQFKMADIDLKLNEAPDERLPDTYEDEEIHYPSQSELDRAVNMPVGDIDDPFMSYNERPVGDE